MAAASTPTTGPPPSKTEQRMAERLETLEPGSWRARILATAIAFKRSWVELARELTAIREQGAFREWGYRTFEAYAQNELSLRRETVQKLVRSFDYLHRYEPSVLEAHQSTEPEAAPIPGYQALDILAEARDNPYLAETDYREIRDQVFRDDPPASAVRRLVKERAPEPPPASPDDPAVRLRKALSLAERLYGLLVEEEVPESIAQAVEQAVGGLRRLLEE